MNNKSQKPYKWVIVVGIIIVVIIIISLTIQNKISYIRPKVEGYIYDSKTKKPIPYALIGFGQITYTTYGWGESFTANEKGYYVIPSIREQEPSSLKDGYIFHRNGQQLQVWFPGYKKKEIRTYGKELFQGKINIYLERPKTAEEAVELLSNGNHDFPFPERDENNFKFSDAAIVHSNYAVNEAIKIVKNNPNSKIADDAYEQASIWASYGDEKTKKIILDKSLCKYLNKKRNWCYEKN